jgi:MFS family permease
MAQESQGLAAGSTGNRALFLGCFFSLVATAVGFIVRAMLINEWGTEFHLTETQKGEIFGVGLWPFSISIVLFSLAIDKIGYGYAMVFAFVCHVSSAIITIFAKDYWSLYLGTLIVALGNGTVEAVVNPVVATMYSKDKTRWLNILHAGWPGGLVLGGVMAIGMGTVDWRWKVGLLLIPTIIYALLLFRRPFPVQERVAAKVPYRDMLKEVGGLGFFAVSLLIMLELGRVFSWNPYASAGAAAALSAIFAFFAGGLGHPIFIFLLLLMIPLATTELGTDSWITALMEKEMTALGLSPAWVLIYTSTIMMFLRLFAGGIVHKLSPLGLLTTSSLVAAAGLFFLSKAAAGSAILVAATIYGFGKTFFWPTMLGVVSERFPRGGAFTINATGGMGMLAAGVIGTVLLGYIQDTSTAANLKKHAPEIYQIATHEHKSVFGTYLALDRDMVPTLSAEKQQSVAKITAESQKEALSVVAIIPMIMFASYAGLALYFRAKGGYRAVDLKHE